MSTRDYNIVQVDLARMELRVFAQLAVEIERHTKPGCCRPDFRKFTLAEMRGRIADERSRKLAAQPCSPGDDVFRARWTHVDSEGLTCGTAHLNVQHGPPANAICSYFHRTYMEGEQWVLMQLCAERFPDVLYRRRHWTRHRGGVK